MFAKSFITLDGNGRLTSARTTQIIPYGRYTCHQCNSTKKYHPEYDTERPWFEHTVESLANNGQRHCPYVKLGLTEIRHTRQLQYDVPKVRPLVYKANWHCNGCDSDYHGERYCITCRTGEHSDVCADTYRMAEVATCVC